MASYFNPTAAFDSAGYDALRSNYKKFLEQKVYYRIEGVMPYIAGFERSPILNSYKSFI